MKDTITQIYGDYILPFCQNMEPWLLWVLIAATFFLVVSILFIRPLRKSIRVFDNHAGHVHVSNKALSELVHSSCRNVESIYKPSVSFATSRGKLHIRVKLKLQQGKRLSEISNMLQAKIATTLQETLSIEKIGRIDIVVVGFIKNSGAEAVQPVLDDSAPNDTESYSSNYQQSEAHSILPAPAPQTSEPLAETDPVKESLPSEAPDGSESTPDEPKKKKSFFGFGSKKKEEASSTEDSLDLDFDSKADEEKSILDSDPFNSDKEKDK